MVGQSQGKDGRTDIVIWVVSIYRIKCNMTVQICTCLAAVAIVTVNTGAGLSFRGAGASILARVGGTTYKMGNDMFNSHLHLQSEGKV